MQNAAVPPLVLVVDDAPAKRRKVCGLIERRLGWRTAEAGTGRQTLERIANALPNIVLTSLELPDVDGVDLVESIRRSHPFVPIVLMTAAANEKSAMKALRAGAASYVPKKELSEALADSLEQVHAAARAAQNRRRLLSCFTKVEFEFVLDNDPALIPALVAHVQDQLAPLKLCDQNGVIRVGVALEEAILNAMYHGNLEVDSQLRQEDESRFHRLIEERRQTPHYASRRLTIRAHLTPEKASFVVADQGKGFDPNTLPDPTDPANLERVGGRGLLLIRTFMNEVSFNPAGNEITLIRFRDARPEEPAA
jgi:CheY-like chemotaxis protein/anti-sigma regulatory factor (Ser/Thr protein kinase)